MFNLNKKSIVFIFLFLCFVVFSGFSQSAVKISANINYKLIHGLGYISVSHTRDTDSLMGLNLNIEAKNVQFTVMYDTNFLLFDNKNDLFADASKYNMQQVGVYIGYVKSFTFRNFIDLDVSGGLASYVTFEDGYKSIKPLYVDAPFLLLLGPEVDINTDFMFLRFVGLNLHTDFAVVYDVFRDAQVNETKDLFRIVFSIGAGVTFKF